MFNVIFCERSFFIIITGLLVASNYQDNNNNKLNCPVEQVYCIHCWILVDKLNQ